MQGETEQVKVTPRVGVFVRIRQGLDEDLEGFCLMRGIKKLAFIEEAIEEKLLRTRERRP